MDDIKQYLSTGIRFHNPEMLNKLRSYDFVLYNGRMLQTKQLVHELVGCQDCSQLLLRVSFLEAKLRKYESPPPKVDLQVVLGDFFEKNYRKIPRRAYSRRSLFLEVQEFLNHEFGIQLLNATDARYRDFMRGIIQDTGEGYKRLRIEKKI